MLQFLLATAALFNYISVPVATMREEPKDSAEIASQAYYSELVNVLEENSNWVKIETTVDHCQGWIKAGQLASRATPFPSASTPQSQILKINRCMAHLYNVQDTVYGPISTLPFDSILEAQAADQDPKSRWIKVTTVDGQEGYIQRGDISSSHRLLKKDQLPLFSMQFLGLPYTWGGRSSFGYDCSGFVQMLYRQMGAFIPRDSKDQHKYDGFTEIAIEKLAPGDLIFFGLDKDKIRHVGMYISDDRFVHATVAENAPYVHISRLSDAEWNGTGRFTYRAARTLKQ